MTHKIDFSTASSEAIIEALGKRLDEIRLSRNIAQADLAQEAGVSRSTNLVKVHRIGEDVTLH